MKSLHFLAQPGSKSVSLEILTDINGCNNSELFENVITVSEDQALSAFFTANPSATCDVPAKIFFTTGEAINGATYNWDFGDGSIVAGVANPTHIYTQPGTYTVTFIASNVTCMDVKTIEITVRDLSTGISSVGTQVFSMYPNPASDVASIKLNLPEREKEISLFLVDGSGKLVKSVTFNQVDAMGTLNLDVSDAATGVYQILLNGEKISSSARLTISR